MQKHWGIFLGMLKKVGVFFGRQILKLGFFGGIKYEPLSDPSVIKICEWGPWGYDPRPVATKMQCYFLKPKFVSAEILWAPAYSLIISLSSIITSLSNRLISSGLWTERQLGTYTKGEEQNFPPPVFRAEKRNEHARTFLPRSPGRVWKNGGISNNLLPKNKMFPLITWKEQAICLQKLQAVVITLSLLNFLEEYLIVKRTLTTLISLRCTGNVHA